MNGYSEVRLHADDRKNLIIELIPEMDPEDYAKITIPAYLMEDFRDQVQHLLGF